MSLYFRGFVFSLLFVGGCLFQSEENGLCCLFRENRVCK